MQVVETFPIDYHFQQLLDLLFCFFDFQFDICIYSPAFPLLKTFSSISNVSFGITSIDCSFCECSFRNSTNIIVIQRFASLSSKFPILEFSRDISRSKPDEGEGEAGDDPGG